MKAAGTIRTLMNSFISRGDQLDVRITGKELRIAPKRGLRKWVVVLSCGRVKCYPTKLGSIHQSTNTRFSGSEGKLHHLLQGAKQGVLAAELKGHKTPGWIAGKCF